MIKQNKNFDNTKGFIFTSIVPTGFDEQIENLSSISKSWEFDINCPVCNHIHTVNKNNANTVFRCPCGRDFYIGISKELL